MVVLNYLQKKLTLTRKKNNQQIYITYFYIALADLEFYTVIIN